MTYFLFFFLLAFNSAKGAPQVKEPQQPIVTLKLDVSPTQIRATKTITNTNDTDVSQDCTLALPPSPPLTDNPRPTFPDWRTAYQALELLNEATDAASPTDDPSKTHYDLSTSAFVNFTVQKDDTPQDTTVTSQILNRAGKDLTQSLQKQGVPESAQFLSGPQLKDLLHRDTGLKSALKKAGLLNSKGYASWRFALSYTWKQTIPALNSSQVVITFQPLVEQASLVGQINPPSLKKLVLKRPTTPAPYDDTLSLKWDDFHLSGDLEQAILSLFTSADNREKGRQFTVEIVTIPLKSLAQKQSLQSLSLTITPPPNCIVLCNFPQRPLLMSDGTYQIDIPQAIENPQDFQVLFVNRGESAEKEK